MTLIFEVSRPFQFRAGRFKSRVMSRYWWGWFAVAILHIPLHEFSETVFDWKLS